MRAAQTGLSIAVLLLCVCSGLMAGEAATSLSGSVKDSTGAVLPRAFLLLWNQETGLSRTGRTDDFGQYTFLSLPPGLYEISVSAPGFRKLTRSGLRLGVSERVTLDVLLQVGRTEDAITVSAEEETLAAATGSMRSSLAQRPIEYLPLNGRDVTQLIMTQPGVVSRDKSQLEGTGYAVNGSRQHGVYYSLDGGTNTDSYRHHSGVFPNASTIAEVSIERSGLSAEYGSTGGAVVSVVLKSGTNNVHASAFEFFRNGALNARDFFSRRRDNLKRSQFGGTVSGPVLRNRLFYFGGFQRTTGRAETQLTRQYLPTAAVRTGDFSAFPGRVVDPVTTVPFPENRVPMSRLSPAAQAILRYIPVPASANGERMISIRDRTGETEYTGRVDYHAFSHRMSGHVFQRSLQTPFSGNTQDLASMYTSAAGRSEQPYLHVTASDVWLVSASTIQTTTFTVRNRRTWNDWSSVDLPIDFARAGVKGIALQNTSSMYLNVAGSFMARPGWNYQKRDRDLQISSVVSHVKGRHAWKGGAELLYIRNHIQNAYRTMGNFEFNGSASGNGMADFLLGEVYQFWQGGGEYKELTGIRTGFFVQDDWRVTQTLTLNAGIRSDPVLPFRDSAGRTQCFVPGAQSTRFPNAPRGYLNDGDAGCPSGGFRSYWNATAPRLGFAWRAPVLQLVIRGGAGVFWTPHFTMAYNGFVNSAPFSPQVTLNGVRFDDPYAGVVNPFPQSFAPFTPASNVSFSTPMGQFGAFGQGFRPGYTNALNFTVERSFAKYWTGRTSWIANLGRQLSYTADANYALFAAGSTLANVQQRRPYSDFASIVLAESGATSSYHALELSATRRAPSGVTAQISYTWSKAIDEYSDESRPGQTVSVAVPYNRAAGRSVADFDITQQLAASWVWPLPMPSSQLRWIRSLTEGWVASGIASVRSGLPFSVRSGSDRSLSGIGQDFADIVGDPQLDSSRSKRDIISRYFDTAAFRLAARGSFGNAPRNLLRGPGSLALDVSVAREWQARDRFRTQLRVDLYNAMNHAALGTPYASLNSPERFGRIETASPARTIQLGLRFSF